MLKSGVQKGACRVQVEDYARRKGMPVAEVEQWLGSRLNYEPDAEAEEREAVAA